MPYADQPKLRRVASLAFALLAALAMLLVATPAAAEPTTPERRQVAEDVSKSFCADLSGIPKLPGTVELSELCVNVLVENIDPDGDNAGMRAACFTALPLSAKLGAEACAQVLDRMLDPARAVFLDRVVPAVQQLACVASAPAAFDCLAQQVHVWLKQ